jgi:hypothetical protein
MSSVELFSVGSVASARYPIANSVPTSEANNDDGQDRKKFLDEAKHLNKAREIIDVAFIRRMFLERLCKAQIP